MANENYENVNNQSEEQHGDVETHDMLDALNKSMDVARRTLTEALTETRNEHPDMDFGSVLRRFHMSLIETIKSKPFQSFHIVFGLLGLAIYDILTDEDKEALRNDLFDNN